MKRLIPLILLLMSLAAMGQTGESHRLNTKPFVRWWWNGDKVDSAEIVRELRLLHDAGIGGVEINPIEFPAKRCDSVEKASLIWLSDEWIDMLRIAMQEARRLGMECDLLVGSGWPIGMESLPMEERGQVMLTYAKPLSNETLTREQLYRAVDPKVTVPNPERVFELVALWVAPDSITDIKEMKPLPLPKGDTLRLEQEKGMLYALIRCRSFASVINGAPGASGAIVDHMNEKAVRGYLERMQHTIEQRIGPLRKWLRAYFTDSMELEGSNWTDDFAQEFKQRNGYDVMPWMPLILFPTGRLGEVTSYDYGSRKSPEMARHIAQARRDYERTKAELLYERYTKTFADWCHSQGVLARGQAYGRGFFPLKGSTAYDIPEGESWTTNYLRHRIGEEMPDSDYRRGRAYTMINKYVSSAAHHSGHSLVSAEEMTNTYRMFETTLELLKLGSDMSAFSGITHSVWHGFNYSPPEAGFPGWVQYGSYLNEQNSWWPYFHLLNEYRSRFSSVLQGLQMETPIAILAPTEQMWGEIGVQIEPFPQYPKGSGYDITPLLWEAIHKNGSGADIVRIDWLLDTMSNGELRYKAVFLPRINYLEGADIRWLLSYADRGGRVFCIDECVVDGEQFIHLTEPDSNHYMEWYREVQRNYELPHCVEIANPDRFLLHNAYRNKEGDATYLFCNASLHTSIGTMIAFPKEVYQGCKAWVYNPATDKKQLLVLDEGSFWLYLPPVESLFIIFEKKETLAVENAGKNYATSQMDTDTIWYPDYYEGSHYFTIPMEWHVTLQHAIEGWIRDTVMKRLCDLRETQFRDFSGTISYTARFHLDSVTVDNEQGIEYTPESLDYIDLGQVYDICELTVNGTKCGTKWYGERIYDNLGGLFHTGENTIEIKVTTTLNNYVHTLTDPIPGLESTVIQHFVIKRKIPTTPAGLVGIDGQIAFF